MSKTVELDEGIRARIIHLLQEEVSKVLQSAIETMQKAHTSAASEGSSRGIIAFSSIPIANKVMELLGGSPSAWAKEEASRLFASFGEVGPITWQGNARAQIEHRIAVALDKAREAANAK